ncbi:hypothetical protein V2I01_26235 [Micromonospora sp. BRA006-A]|nr:hypothetical protein [Micromonospora sp. BRA006-A]
MSTAAPALTPTTRALAWCLHLLIIGLLVLAAGRAVADDRPHAGSIVAVAVACGLAYAIGPLLPASGARGGPPRGGWPPSAPCGWCCWA